MLKCLSTCFHQWEIPVVSIRLPLVWKSIGKWLFNFLIHISKYFLDDFKAWLAIFVLMNIKDAVFVNWSSFSNCTSLTDECAASLSFSVRAALHPYHPVPIKQLGNNNKAHFKPLQWDFTNQGVLPKWLPHIYIYTQSMIPHTTETQLTAWVFVVYCMQLYLKVTGNTSN